RRSSRSGYFVEGFASPIEGAGTDLRRFLRRKSTGEPIGFEPRAPLRLGLARSRGFPRPPLRPPRPAPPSLEDAREVLGVDALAGRAEVVVPHGGGDRAE